MAAESSDTDPDPEEVEWASQDAYQEETSETNVVVLPDGQMKMEVATMKPLKFASLIQEYRITDLARDLGEIPEDADVGDIENADLEAAEPDDFEEVDSQLRVVLFIRDVLMPQIVRPEKVHWADPDHIGDPEWFDLSDLTENDQAALIAAVTGEDASKVIEGAEERADQFPG